MLKKPTTAFLAIFAFTLASTLCGQTQTILNNWEQTNKQSPVENAFRASLRFSTQILNSKGRPTEARSSATFVSPKGHIATAAHCLYPGFKTKIIDNITTYVSNNEGRTWPVRILAVDLKNDLALLQAELEAGETVPYTPIGNSGDVPLGSEVFTIGSPFGSGLAVTRGILSSKARVKPNSRQIILQTDADINPGNSGGGLFNTQGQLIGVAHSILVSKGLASSGIAYACPSNLLYTLARSTYQDKKTAYGSLPGLRLVGKPRDQEPLKGRKLMKVYSIKANSPAAKTGLQKGDVIEKINDIYIHNQLICDYVLATSLFKKNNTVSFYRGDRHFSREIKLVAKTLDQDQIPGIFRAFNGIGLKSARLNGQRVWLVALSEESSPWRDSFSKGAVLTKANGKPIKTLESLSEIFQTPKSYKLTFLTSLKNGTTYEETLTGQSKENVLPRHRGTPRPAPPQ